LLVLVAVGLGWTASIILAILSGVLSATFVYRERSFAEHLNHRGTACQIELKQLTERLELLYVDSLACLVYFDAGGLTVDRMSPGLMEGLRIAPDASVRGQSLADILRVSQSQLEAIVNQSKEKGFTNQPFKLTVRDTSGCQIQTMMTVNYLPQVHMVEASIFFVPTSDREEIEEVERAKKDLDRFRKGLYRRESRVLELKEEVNDLLRQSGRPARYQIDRSSDEVKPGFPGLLTSREKGGRDE
jgi:hypothetical protein